MHLTTRQMMVSMANSIDPACSLSRCLVYDYLCHCPPQDSLFHYPIHQPGSKLDIDKLDIQYRKYIWALWRMCVCVCVGVHVGVCMWLCWVCARIQQVLGVEDNEGVAQRNKGESCMILNNDDIGSLYHVPLGAGHSFRESSRCL